MPGYLTTATPMNAPAATTEKIFVAGWVIVAFTDTVADAVILFA